MAAPATKPRSAPRRAPARAAAAKPRQARKTAASSAAPRARAAPARRAAPAPVRLVPAAAGRAADAVGAVAESGPIVRLTRGPAWIGLIAVLLVGIVALNVGTLSLSSKSSRTGAAADELRLANSNLRGDLAGEVTSKRVQSLAADLGFALPAAGDVRYVEPAPGDAAKAAERLRSGSLAGGVAVVPDSAPSDRISETELPIDPTVVAPEAAVDPVSGLPIDPATGLPVAPEAVAAP